MGNDPFGFDTVRVEDTAALDIDAFAPKPRPTNRDAAKAVREVARTEGFTRRTQAKPSDPVEAPADAKPRKRRVNITELLGIQDRYPETERAQLNMLAPVPIVLRWRKLVTDRHLPAWETLEAAMEALEAAQEEVRKTAAVGRGGGSPASTPRAAPTGEAPTRSESQ
jgi:hypothetical protein